MIPHHLILNIRQKLRLAGILALLALVLGGAFYSWAQGDTPIVIGDGSLTIESAVPWASFTGTGRTRTHPHTAKAVPTVTVTLGGQTQTVNFAGERCSVAVTYGATVITVATGNNGRRLQITTDFNSFHTGATPNLLVHNDATQKISHVTVTKGNQTPIDSNASGGTKIVIGYR